MQYHVTRSEGHQATASRVYEEGSVTQRLLLTHAGFHPAPPLSRELTVRAGGCQPSQCQASAFILPPGGEQLALPPPLPHIHMGPQNGVPEPRSPRPPPNGMMWDASPRCPAVARGNEEADTTEGQSHPPKSGEVMRRQLCRPLTAAVTTPVTSPITSQ